MEEEKKEEQKRWAHDFLVHHGEETKGGAEHLSYDLDREEAKTLFDQARADGKAEFQDKNQKNFTLKYDFGSGKYTVEKRQQ